MTNDKPEVYNKELVEKLSPGTLILSIHNGGSFWGEEERARRLSDIIVDKVKHAEELGIGECKILRLVVVTGDYVGEITEWNKQLDEAWRAPSEGAIAQTLTWGDGQPLTTYSVIILHQAIALGLVESEDETKATSEGTLIHELAHVHDNIRHLSKIGPQPVPKQGDWISYRQFIARSIWGEFFSEMVAYPYVKDHYLDEYIDHGINMLHNAISDVKQEMLAFQSHRDAHEVWAVAVDKLSAVFNQLGRCLGLLVSAQRMDDNNNQIDQFAHGIGEISKDWEQVVRQLIKKLANIEREFEEEKFNNLGEVVDQGFRTVDLEPYDK